MARYLDPKCKQCRRLGEKLFLKGERCFSPKCAMVKRNYPPGMHGPKGTARLSPYGQQLREKQKALKSYRLLESQFANYFKKAKQVKGDTGENLMRLLEMRLDNVIYRLGLAPSRDTARQLVNHGHILVNGRKIDIPSYQLRINDTTGVEARLLQTKPFQDILKKVNKKEVPSWLTYLDEKKGQAKIINLPSSADSKQGINTAMIVEYYSR